MSLTVFVWNQLMWGPVNKRPTEEVEGAKVYLIPYADPLARRGPLQTFTRTPDGTTNKKGIARIPLDGRADGWYILRVLPDPWSLDPVGPKLFKTGPMVERIYRPYDVDVELRTANKKTGVFLGFPKVWSLGMGEATQTDNKVSIALLPVWMRAEQTRSRGNKKLDLIIVHRTTGKWTKSALGHLTDKSGGEAHYLIDKKGNMVKLAREAVAARNLKGKKKSYWGGDYDPDDRTIGIELVNYQNRGNWRADLDFTEPQFKKLIRLLEQLVNEYQFDPTRIIGHGDAEAINGTKSFCPGLKFDWPRLEEKKLGLQRGAGTARPSPDPYDGFFETYRELVRGDDDDKQRYSRAKRPEVTGRPVELVQKYLKEIGYWSGRRPDGDFGGGTARGALHFQYHFFAGTGRAPTENRIDADTAYLIYNVWKNNPHYT